MTGTNIQTGTASARRAWAQMHLHWRAASARAVRWRAGRLAASKPSAARRLRVRRSIIVIASLVVLGGGIAAILGWRLASGPIGLDVMTPWLISSLEQRLGEGHRISVGGTQLERDEDGRSSLRLRDIVVRSADGAVVASAPKAEVGVSAAGLLTGRLQAERISLIGATMSVRIEPDGQITLFTGTESRPLVRVPAVITPKAPAGGAPVAGASSSTVERSFTEGLASFLTWIEGLDALGLDGGGLTELGLKSGALIVDDRRIDKRWTFENINLSLTRPREGGVAFAVNSSGSDGPWSLTATVSPLGQGRRAFEAVLRDLSPKDLLLAMRIDAGAFSADMPISAMLRADIGPDGAPTRAEARIVAGAGNFGDPNEPANRVLIDEAHLSVRWDQASRKLIAPLEVSSGKSRVSLVVAAEAPPAADAPWLINVNRGVISIAPAERAREAPLLIDRIDFRARFDPVKRRLDIDKGDFTGMAAGIAMSGSIDYSNSDPHIAIGVAATRMSALTFKRIWPLFVASDLRAWVAGSLFGGTIDRIVIATHAPFSTLRKDGPPIPDDGLSVELVASNAVLRPIDSLPMLRECDVNVRVKGRHAEVKVGRGVAELPSGRKMTLTSGSFEVPDTDPKRPPSRIKMRVEGTIDAVAELVAMDPIREPSGTLFNAGTTRGAVVGTVVVNTPVGKNIERHEVTYHVEADVTNFSAERFVRGHKAEAQAMRVVANAQGIQARGDMRIGGAPAFVEYRKPVGVGDAEVRLQTTLDDSSRARFGLDTAGLLSGPVPVRLSGRIGSGDNESRFQVELDLLHARIVELMPGWNKPAGKATRASVVIVERPHSLRFEDVAIEGAGTSIRGAIELDSDGEIVSANLPVFALSDGDKASVRAERATDGTMRVQVRGDVFDGRGFVKSMMKGSSDQKKAMRDLDLDIRLGAVAGFNGEALRSVEARMSRRAGQVRAFSLNAKAGRDSTIIGDLRGRGGRQLVYIETDDAGALFRFSDTYPRIVGGQMWVAMDPPSGDQTPQNGVLNIRDFSVRGEPALDRVAATPAPGEGGVRASAASTGVHFSRMKVDFVRSPGKLTIRDGVVWGPAVGATLEGDLDYARDQVRMRGTFVPAYALNNMLARIPIVGFFLGGNENEGLLGLTFEVAGSPSAPTLRVNPMSAVAPGFLRKIFEFRRADDRAMTPPQAER